MIPYVTPKHPKGVVGFCTTGWARTEDFWVNLMLTQVPNGTGIEKRSGTGLASMFNGIARATLEDPTNEWLWILGDDHTWQPDLLRTMIDRAEKHKCDILVPLVCRKLPPFSSVLFNDDELRYSKTDCLDFHDLPNTPEGEPTEVAKAGTAGMLVQRRVLEAMQASGEPFFREAWSAPDALGEDIWFVNLAKQLGFKVWVDQTLSMGHSPYGVSILPEKIDGVWYIKLAFPEGKWFRVPLPRPQYQSTQETP